MMNFEQRPPWRWYVKFGVMLAVAIVFVAGVLYGAASLDEGKRPTRVADNSERDLFTVEVKEEPGPILVLECDEGNYGDANLRFREFLGVVGPPIAVPGGALLLAKLPEELSAEHGALARAAIEAIKRQAPERIILIAHSDCLLYDVGGAYFGHPEMVRPAQYLDLAKAAKLIGSWLPKTKVETYYALKKDGKIRFNPVTIGATTKEEGR